MARKGPIHVRYGAPMRDSSTKKKKAKIKISLLCTSVPAPCSWLHANGCTLISNRQPDNLWEGTAPLQPPPKPPTLQVHRACLPSWPQSTDNPLLFFVLFSLFPFFTFSLFSVAVIFFFPLQRSSGSRYRPQHPELGNVVAAMGDAVASSQAT